MSAGWGLMYVALLAHPSILLEAVLATEEQPWFRRSGWKLEVAEKQPWLQGS